MVEEGQEHSCHQEVVLNNIMLKRWSFLEDGRGALAAEDMAFGVCVLVLQLQDQF